MNTITEINNFKEKLLQDKSNSTVASYAYFPLIGWIIPLFHKREDSYCQHHTRQGYMFAIFFIYIVIGLNIANIFILSEWYEIRLGLAISIYAVYAIYPILCILLAIMTKRGKKFDIPFIGFFARGIEL